MLVGTASVAKSERLASLLLRKGIPHEVLNAKQHAREAAIIANAGRKGAVTIATNMAGRGTDIMLGGNPEFAADLTLRERGLTPDETPEEYEAAWADALEKAKVDAAKEHDEVVDLGGLYVLGTERHESRRIDNQLRGRSGRQGDPGESRFYLSLGDDLMVRFNGERVAAMMNFLRLPEDVPIEARPVSKAIQSAQTQMEQQNFEIRKNVLKYDEVMNKQRTVIYDERRTVLDGADLSGQIRSMIDDVVTRLRRRRDRPPATPRSGISTSCGRRCKTLYPVSLTIEEAIDQAGGDQGRPDPRVPDRGAARRRAGRLRRARGGPRRRGAARARAAGAAVGARPPAGASTSTRWTTCRRASACARWPSATRWSSTSARASTCSPP